MRIAKLLTTTAVFMVLGSTAIATGHQDNPYATHHELGLMQGFPPPADRQVDRSNGLFGVPYNRWSYQNMRTIWPSANIPSPKASMPLKIDPDGGIERLAVPRLDGSIATMDDFLRETFTDAYVVIKGDEIVFERYLNGMHADQPHQMMSVTKSFAGLFGLMAVEEGLVSEDDSLTEVIPEFEGAGAFGGDATFRHVLDMTASINFSEDYADPNSGIQQYGRVLGLLEASADERVANTIYEYLPMLPKDDAHEHGEVFHYQTPKTDVVNWVTNRVTGQSFQDQLTELMAGIGAKGETYVLLDRNGTLFAGGGLNATPRNLARFAVMMLNDGQAGDAQVVPETVIAALEAGASRDAFSNGPNGKKVYGDGNWSYRAQWWVRHTPGREAINALGIHGQWITIDRKNDIAIIKQSSDPISSDEDIDAYHYNAIDAVTDYLTGS
ncbi:serine hydrolase domain-containing protein [Primorskyibacter sp. S87]|uniref:serine hydrolase domain-containing protein n=1 Tax=Primorskyibacter sp. S87 TaxID=3415126 RepID=UPI003C7E8191